MKSCTKCGEEKPLEDFGKDNRLPDGRQARCKACINADARKRHAERMESPEARERLRQTRAAWDRRNPGQVAARMRKWRKANPEKHREAIYARRSKQPYSPELAAFMKELVKQPCAYCGTTENITVDHIEPLSRGGKHEASNLAPACFPCNSSKSNRSLSEWVGRLEAA